MSSKIPRTLHVLRKVNLTANMVRFTLGGEQLKDFPGDQESGYIKLLLPEDCVNESGESVESKRPRMRTYTIRAHRPETLELDIDFVLHGDNGPASAWAMNAVEGDEVSIVGPGAKKMVDFSADWFFLAGDMTALPAISVNLEQLPKNARGYAVIEILHEDDRQTINAPEGMELHWVINPVPDRPNSILQDAVKALPWLEGTPYIWVASEFDAMRSLRRYFKQEKGVQRQEIYASSYWKMGTSDEGNKAAKREDTEAD